MSFEEAPVRPEVELHIDTTVIDHSVVPIRWCLSRGALEKMRARPEYDWALVIAAQKKGYRDETRGVYIPGSRIHETRFVAKGLQAIADAQGFLTFRSPGDYDVVTYLVRGGGGEEQRRAFGMQLGKLEKRQRNGPYEEDFTAMKSDGNPDRWIGTLQAEALEHIEVSIPQGAFAKPLPKWVVRQLRHYELGDGEDECAGRWRIALAFTLLPFVEMLFILIGGFLVRLWLTILGVLHFLVGGNPLVPWSAILEPNVVPRDSFWMSSDFVRLSLFQGASWILAPASFLFVGLLGAVGYLASSGSWIPGAIAAGVLGLLYLGVRYEDKLEAHASKTALSKREASVQAGIAFLERRVVCGEEATNAPRKITLMWSGVKRLVCKPRPLL